MFCTRVFYEICPEGQWLIDWVCEYVSEEWQWLIEWVCEYVSEEGQWLIEWVCEYVREEGQWLIKWVCEYVIEFMKELIIEITRYRDRENRDTDIYILFILFPSVFKVPPVTVESYYLVNESFNGTIIYCWGFFSVNTIEVARRALWLVHKIYMISHKLLI